MRTHLFSFTVAVVTMTTCLLGFAPAQEYLNRLPLNHPHAPVSEPGGHTGYGPSPYLQGGNVHQTGYSQNSVYHQSGYQQQAGYQHTGHHQQTGYAAPCTSCAKPSCEAPCAPSCQAPCEPSCQAPCAPTCQAPCEPSCEAPSCGCSSGCNSGCKTKKLCLPNPLCVLQKLGKDLERCGDSICYGIEAVLTPDPCCCKACGISGPICPKEKCGKAGCQSCNNVWSGYKPKDCCYNGYSSMPHSAYPPVYTPQAPYTPPVESQPMSPFGDDPQQPSELPPPRRPMPPTMDPGSDPGVDSGFEPNLDPAPSVDPTPGGGLESVPGEINPAPVQPPIDFEGKLFAPPSLKPRVTHQFHLPARQPTVRQANYTR